MCVMAICSKARPDDEMIGKMWSRNPHGVGVAWRDGDLVRWKKGLTEEETKAICRHLPMPFVVHFRAASVGGITPILTHPFAIDDFEKSLDLEGSTNGNILFHNGHWSDWRKASLETAVKLGPNSLPNGKWSDTRAMAWLSKIYGLSYLEIVDEKVIKFGPRLLEVTKDSEWKKVNDIWCSNDYFVQNDHEWRKMCRFRTCVVTSNLDSNGYCPNHPHGKEKPRSTTITSTVISSTRQLTEGQVVTSTPLSKEALLVKGEDEHRRLKQGLITRDQLTISKNELKRLRKEVNGTTIEMKPSTEPSAKATI